MNIIKTVKWMNVKTGDTFFGLQIMYRRKWRFIADGDKPLFFKTLKEAKKSAEEMMQKNFKKRQLSE